MAMKTKEYNLLDEEWIPVLWADGKYARMGIMEVLKQAHRIRQIAASNPMDRVAILRFLLAILYWCKGNPPEDGCTITSFPDEWFSKLDENRDCFNLLGEGKRFYQQHVTDGGAENRTHEVIPLVHEIPNGDDKWHFRHSTDKVNGLCYTCCAMGLVRLPVFTSGEGRGWHQGINGTPPIYVLRIGGTLLRALLANWVRCEQLGDAAWVRPGVRPRDTGTIPLLVGLTLLPRRVWLHTPMTEPGVCIGCGQRAIPIIRTCEYQTAGKLENDGWNDPHVVYSNTAPPKTAKAEDLTEARKFRMDRPWPALLAGIAARGVGTYFIVGFATDKAKNIDVWERTVSLPAMSEGAALLAEQWQKECWKMERRIGRSKEEGAAVVASIRPHVEDRVSARAGELLAGNNEAWQQAAEGYRPMMEAVAKSLSPGFTTEAVLRRRQIASISPNMRVRKEEDK